MTTSDFSHEEIERYRRHLLLPEVGMAGQRRLKGARVLIVGAGGLGCPVAMYLAAAGVGRLGLVDFDRVDATNLQRQLLYRTADTGRPKLEAAAEALAAINPHVEITPHPVRLTAANALDLLGPYDLVVDGTDNFATRYLVNDACVLLGKPNVYGSIYRFEGKVSVLCAPAGPCYRCLYPDPPPPELVPNCAEGGVLGVLPGLVGMLQATEAVKLILGQGEPLVGRLLLLDALKMSFTTLKIRRSAQCPACGDEPTIDRLVDIEQACAAEGAPPEDGAPEISVQELHRQLERGEPLFVLDVREPHEADICRLERSTLIPLGQLPGRLAELPAEGRIVVHCRSGGRSARAIGLLREAGFGDVFNLTGGILAWAEQVDRGMARY